MIDAPANAPPLRGADHPRLPVKSERAWRTRDGWELVIRPIEPADADRWVDFVTNLSPATNAAQRGSSS